MKTVLAETYSRFTTSLANDDRPRNGTQHRFTELVFSPVAAHEEAAHASRNPSSLCSAEGKENILAISDRPHGLACRLLPGKPGCGFQATVHEIPFTDDVGGGGDGEHANERDQAQRPQITVLPEYRSEGRGRDSVETRGYSLQGGAQKESSTNLGAVGVGQTFQRWVKGFLIERTCTGV
ncbi:MAG: hypothetical protein LQ351_001311 [Letrouitia transgressa]|nr:MAG: hypothetical protein LQ351_001311 [Letrouitia transgressa]